MGAWVGSGGHFCIRDTPSREHDGVRDWGGCAYNIELSKHKHTSNQINRLYASKQADNTLEGQRKRLSTAGSEASEPGFFLGTCFPRVYRFSNGQTMFTHGLTFLRNFFWWYIFLVLYFLLRLYTTLSLVSYSCLYLRKNRKKETIDVHRPYTFKCMLHVVLVKCLGSN